jgi:hypothetical protein
MAAVATSCVVGVVEHSRGNSKVLWCSHGVHGSRYAWRIRAGTPWHEGKAGLWQCERCHPPATPLVQHGHVEFADGRVTPELRPLVPSPIEKGQLRMDRQPVQSDTRVTAKALVPSEAQGPSAREQASPGPVGSESGQLPDVEEPVREAAPAPKRKATRARRKPAEPQGEGLF